MGLLAAKHRRSADAEALFRKSLKMREEWYGSSHPLVAEIFDALASLACSDASDSPDVAVAEELFRRALYMQEDLLGCSHLMVANTLFKLGGYQLGSRTKVFGFALHCISDLSISEIKNNV